MNLTNATAEQDVSDQWSEQLNLIRILTTILVPLVFGIIVFVGIIGNALVILVVVKNRQMRNTTNVLILNLAMADLLFIVLCVPFTAVDYALNSWPFGLTWCQSVQYLIYVTSYVSIYTLILMSFDRFLAVVFPVSALPYRTVKNAVCATVVTWALIGGVLTPIWFAHSLRPKFGPVNETLFNITNVTMDEYIDDEDLICEDNDTEAVDEPSCQPVVEEMLYWCRFSEEKGYSLSSFYIALFVSGYAIPLLLIVIMYIFMLKRLWNPVGQQKISQEALRNKRRVTRLVMIVIIVFAACWAPIQFVLLFKAVEMYHLRGPEDFKRIIFQIFAQVLAYVNSCVNPILYAFLSDNFRKAFHQLLPLCFHRFSGLDNGSGMTSRGRGRLHYELTTLRPNDNRRDSSFLGHERAPSGSTGSNPGANDTRRYGKRGRLVKHSSRDRENSNPRLSVVTSTIILNAAEVEAEAMALNHTIDHIRPERDSKVGEKQGDERDRPDVVEKSQGQGQPSGKTGRKKAAFDTSSSLQVRTFVGEEGILCTEL